MTIFGFYAFFFFVLLLQDFIEYHAERELQRLPTIVAMATIRRSAISSSVISSLILASEFGDIIILDTQAFTIMHQVHDMFDEYSQH